MALDRELAESHVLAVVGEFVAELGSGRGRSAPTLDDSLERDLGIGSLERVELMLRLERATGVRVADGAMIAAETARDLVGAVVSQAPTGPDELPRLRAPVGDATPAPESARTLVDVLRWHAQRQPARTHIFLREDDGTRTAISHGALWEQAAAVAAALRERGLNKRDAVAIMLRTEAAFFPVFFGTLMAGGVPVPMYPPFRADRIEEYARRQVAILRNADARVMITFGEAERVAGLLRGQVPSLGSIVTAERLMSDGPAKAGHYAPSSGSAKAGHDALSSHPAKAEHDMSLPHLPALMPDDPALIQYTSGSTDEPKGVLLTHRNLLANIRAIAHGLDIRADDVGVSWLPLYHDMGLIGAWLGTLYFGTPVAIMSPLAFLSRPARWLWMLHEHRATMSPAPNFAFDLCARKVADAELEGLDLSAVRLLLNGSEPVLADTIERFTTRFARYGLRPEAICPVYGLAECSVGLACSPPGRMPRVDAVARGPFQERGIAEPAGSNAPAVRFVGCGRSLPDHSMRIVDEDGCDVAERIVGRIQFKGPSVTSGYFRNPGATREAFTADGWMDSGDLGYFAEGELFVTGRRKDLIIKGGRNIAPQEVERAAEVRGVRPGCVAAFGVADPRVGTERLVIVAESRESHADARRRIEAAIVDRVAASIGVPPDVVAVTRPGAVLKTSSGKIRRGATRDAYVNGTLGRRRALLAQWLALVTREAAWRIARVAGRARALVYTAYVALVVIAAAPVLWLLLRLSPTRRAADRGVRRWCRLMLVLAGCRVDVRGQEHLHALDRAMLVANHASYLDTIAVLGRIPFAFTFVAKRRLGDYPLVGTAIRKLECLTIDRSGLSERMAGAEEVAAALNRGESLFIFPEGTFIRARGLLPFRLGAFRAAVDARCPLVPIALRGTRAIWPDGFLLERPGRVTITIGAPLQPGRSDWQEIVRLRDQARAAIARECGEAGGL